MKSLKKFMSGRYGGDQLSIVLLVTSMLLTTIGYITKLSLFMPISYIPLIFSVYRMFSKDIPKRRMENYKFSILISPIYSKYKNIKRKFKERKTYKYFKCSNCHAELRLPKGKGRIKITCPKCKVNFEGRT
jgi:DNA-directed RNA polymerase subunit RPC12/RpoP